MLRRERRGLDCSGQRVGGYLITLDGNDGMTLRFFDRDG
jgi:hypothetical protein